MVKFVIKSHVSGYTRGAKSGSSVQVTPYERQREFHRVHAKHYRMLGLTHGDKAMRDKYIAASSAHEKASFRYGMADEAAKTNKHGDAEKHARAALEHAADADRLQRESGIQPVVYPGENDDSEPNGSQYESWREDPERQLRRSLEDSAAYHARLAKALRQHSETELMNRELELARQYNSLAKGIATSALTA